LSKRNNMIVLIIIGLLVAACGPGATADPTATQPDAQAVFTAAAQTAEAKMALTAAVTPTSLPPTPTGTPTATQPVTTTQALTATSTPPGVVAGAGIDLITFVADLTVPDGTTYNPGDTFVKTWRLKNNGSTTWTTAYSLVFISGDQMNGAASTLLTVQVAPGATLDISANLTAPATPGTYTGNWMLRNAGGKNFGLGPIADTPFYVQIVVPGEVTPGTPSVTTTGTPGATSTATPTTAASGNVVKDVAISVDVASYEGTCPYAFNFTAEFTLNQDATVTYQLEADTGFSIDLPAATTVALAAGKQTINYRLEFTDSLSGWARLHVSAPEDVRSSQVTFSLTCQ
jgi:hypothetical protein